MFFTNGSVEYRVEIEANMYSRPVLKKDIKKTLFRMKRASRETEAHLMHLVMAMNIYLVIKFAKVIIAPNDL